MGDAQPQRVSAIGPDGTPTTLWGAWRANRRYYWPQLLVPPYSLGLLLMNVWLHLPDAALPFLILPAFLGALYWAGIPWGRGWVRRRHHALLWGLPMFLLWCALIIVPGLLFQLFIKVMTIVTRG